MQRVIEFVLGLTFGLGLLISGMTDPGKVQGFLDLAGAWDPSLTYEGFELREAKPEALPKSFAAAVAEAQRSAPAQSALR